MHAIGDVCEPEKRGPSQAKHRHGMLSFRRAVVALPEKQNQVRTCCHDGAEKGSAETVVPKRPLTTWPNDHSPPASDNPPFFLFSGEPSVVFSRFTRVTSPQPP